MTDTPGHSEGTFTGAAGHEIYWQAWVPEDPKAVVVLAHGLHEHSGRYARVAERLNRAGYAVWTVDHAGHGRSGGTKGNVGTLAGVLDDFGRLRRMAQDKHPGLPLVVLGHSMGGLIALDYLVSKGQEGVAALAVSGAAVDTSAAGGLQSKLAPVIGRVAPNLGVLLLGATNVSRDPVVVKDYENDPLNHNGKVRARTGAEMLRSVQRVVAGLPQLTVPVIVMHGSADKLVPVAGSRLIEERIGSSDKTLKIYDGLYHEIFNEPEREQVLDDLVAWLDVHA
jgi:alpha-beta hydrolase superfamily lysophospholipase